MAHPRVLISGAGIAGPVVAFWLARAGIRSTIVEQSPGLRTQGQHLDVHGVARDIVEKMGLMETLKAAGTHEEGAHAVDEHDRIYASFPTEEGGKGGPVCDIEVLRHKMAKVFYDATKDNTEYLFSDSIKRITDTPATNEKGSDAVEVEFEGGSKRSYDVVVLADGMFSKARSMLFKTQRLGISASAHQAMDDAEIKFRPSGFITAYFAIPWREEDGMWSRWYVTTGKRSIWMRPDKAGGTTRVYLITLSSIAQTKLKDYRSMSVLEQKAVWREIYQGTGWQTDRILDGMDHPPPADDAGFYMHEIAQVKARSWHKGRVVLVGDAAYCPSPMSGMGTSCAITGAYVLANELARAKDLGSREEVEAAAERYEAVCRPYVEQAQDAPWGVIKLAAPQGPWALGLLRFVVRCIGWVMTAPRLRQVLSKIIPDEPDEKIKLPAYGV